MGEVVPEIFEVFDADAESEEAGREVFLPPIAARRSMVDSTAPKLVAIATADSDPVRIGHNDSGYDKRRRANTVGTPAIGRSRTVARLRP